MMQKKMIYRAFFLILIRSILFFQPVQSFQMPTINLFKGPHSLFIDQELYHMRRSKSGSRQTGYLFGQGICYRNIRPRAIYWAGDIFFGRGTLRGSTRFGSPLKSKKQDLTVEGRVGYNFHWTLKYPFSFVLFGGGGNFSGKNNFVTSPGGAIHINNSYKYIVLGMHTRCYLTEVFSFGVDYKVQCMMDGKSKITNDPTYGRVDLMIEGQTGHTLELPVHWHLSKNKNKNLNMDLALTPYYQFRHYGGRENFPFDFVDTKYYLHGIKLTLSFLF